MSWETGSGRVQELLSAGELGQVPPDIGLARRMLSDAARHLVTAAAVESMGYLPGAATAHREQVARELIAVYKHGCSQRQYGDAWKDERIIDDYVPEKVSPPSSAAVTKGTS